MPEGIFGLAATYLLHQRAQEMAPVIDFVHGFKPAIAMFYPIRGVRVASHSAALIRCQLSHVLVMKRGYLGFADLPFFTDAFGEHRFGREGVAVQDGLDSYAVDTQIDELRADERDDAARCRLSGALSRSAPRFCRAVTTSRRLTPSTTAVVRVAQWPFSSPPVVWVYAALQ